ncbi:MAG TPA: hypothetical protein VIJ92_05725 [Ginsengibacter sp.]
MVKILFSLLILSGVDCLSSHTSNYSKAILGIWRSLDTNRYFDIDVVDSFRFNKIVRGDDY